MTPEELEKMLNNMEDSHKSQVQNHQKMVFQKKIGKFQEMRLNLQKTKQDWLRFLVATSGTLFSILIALGDKKEIPFLSSWVLAGALLSLGCGVLFLAIALYELMFHLEKEVEIYAKHLQEFSHKDSHKTLGYESPAIFGICEKIGYVSLALGIVLLMVFVLFVLVLAK